MILNTLKIKNFKGIKDFEFKPNEIRTSIYGDNATGKSTLYDAYLWLLFGKNSLQQKNFGIKPNGVDMRNESVVVVGEFSNPRVTLERRYAEKWTKERGNASEIFSGHVSTYLVDGVSVKETEYNNTINKLGSEEVFKIISNPLYFNNLKNEERRNIILGLVSDIMTEPPHDMTLLSQQLKAIEKEIKDIPVRINELGNTVKDLPDGEDNLKANLEKSKTEKIKLENEMKSYLDSSDRLKTINEIREQMKKIEMEHQKYTLIRTQEAYKKRQEYDEKLLDLRKNLNSISANIPKYTFEVEQIDKTLELLRTQYKELNAKKVDVDKSCPTCRQSIPEENYSKAVADFNLEKSNKLSEIQAHGKSLNEKKTELQKKMNLAEEEVKALNEKIEKLTNEKEAIKDNLIALDSMESYKQLQDKEFKLLNTPADDKTKELQSQIYELDQDIKNILYYLARAETNNDIISRINELKAHEKTLGTKYRELSKMRDEVIEHTRTQIQNAESAINSKFQNVRFKLFEEQINGEIKDVCITTYLGIDYNDLNNAAKINCGLDIINALIEFYGKSFPVWIDNAESITEIWTPKAQTICLVVDVKYNQLKIV